MKLKGEVGMAVQKSMQTRVASKNNKVHVTSLLLFTIIRKAVGM